MSQNGIILLLYILISGQLAYLSWTDISKREISNKGVMVVAVLAVALSLLKYHDIFLLSAGIALVVGFLLFQFNVMGGGDAKLIAVLMLALPTEQITTFLFLTTFSGLFLIIFGWLFFRKSIKENGLPYGVAISFGFLATLALFHY